MAINKVVYNGSVLIDLTEDTVSAASLMAGLTAHDKSGTKITGTASVSVDGETLVMPDGLVEVS